MKLVFLVNNLPPVVDGVGDYTWNLAHELAKKGSEVYIISTNNKKIEEPKSTAVKILPIISRWNYKGTRELIVKINSLQPDWLLLQYVPYAFQKKGVPLYIPSLLKECKAYCRRIMVFFHEVAIRLRVYPLSWLFISFMQRRIALQICLHADEIATSIDIYQDILRKLSKKKISVIPIGSNILPHEVSEHRIASIKKLIAPNGERIISTFGVRNHTLLISLHGWLSQLGKRYRMLIIGTVKDQTIYKNNSLNAFVTGYLNGSEVFDYLKASDLFVLPDDLEKKSEGGTSNKSGALAAALAADLPVLGIKGDMNNKLLQNIPSIFLWDTNANKELTNYILDTEGGLTGRSGNASFFQAHLSWEKISQQYLEIIE